MSFLTPLFLLGALAVAAPILFHLVRRTTRERQVFSSLMFLAPSPPRLSKRHRLEHILLLILRCLAILLLAAGFARPFFKQTPLGDPAAALPKRMLVLVDVSASMQRAGVWAAARERAEQIVRSAGPADHVALFTFDRQATPLLSFEEWNRTAPGDRVALATSRLASLSPGWGGTQLGFALITAGEAIAESETRTALGTTTVSSDGPRQIVLVSDLQAGSRLDTLQAYEWPKGVELVVEPVKARNPTNAGLQLIVDAGDSTRAIDQNVRVRVTNSADAKREEFTLGWARPGTLTEFAAPPLDAYVPPGQSRVFAVPVPKDMTGLDRLILRGDDEPFDNALYIIPPVQQQTGVLWLGTEKEGDTREPLFFVRRAFFDTPRLAIEVKVRDPAAAGRQDLEAAQLIFVSGALPPPAIAALREQVEEGKVVAFVLKSAAAGESAGALIGRPDLGVSEVRPNGYAMLAEIDFRHPLFAPFSDPRFSDFTKIYFWKYRRFDAGAIDGARVLAAFDSGDPALVEVPIGQGRVFILASGWHPEDSQLALSSKFVPLLWSWLELAGGVELVTTQYFVGDKVPVPAAGEFANVRLPEGAPIPLPKESAEFAQTGRPGIYEFSGSGRSQRFAVNIDASESRTAPLGIDELLELGVPVAQPQVEAVRLPESTALLQAVEAENRQKLWRWIIAATLAVLLVESAFAGWTARRSALQTEAVT
jgi:hypothetical protein